jgi:hypothetical protein
MLVIGVKAREALIILKIQSVVFLSRGINWTAPFQARDYDLGIVSRPIRLISLYERRPLHTLVQGRPPHFEFASVHREDLLGLEGGGISRLPIIYLPIITVPTRHINVAPADSLMEWIDNLRPNITGDKLVCSDWIYDRIGVVQ